MEVAVEWVHLSPAMALSWEGDWYVRKARLALRQAERSLAAGDDPRLSVLKPLRAQIATHRRVHVDRDGNPIKRRKRFRCPTCMTESLRREGENMGCYRRDCYGTVEPVARHRKTA
jgi:hypothetical protein